MCFYCFGSVLKLLTLINCRMETAQNQFREVASANVVIKNRLQQTGEQLKKVEEEKKKIELQAAIAKYKFKAMQTQVANLEVVIGSAELEKRKQNRKLQDATKRLQRFAARSESCSKFHKVANVATANAVHLKEQLVSAQKDADEKAREVGSLQDEAVFYSRQHEVLEKQNTKLRAKLSLFERRDVSVRGHRMAVNAAVSRADELGEAITILKQEHDVTVVRLQKERIEAVTRLTKERDDALGRLVKERDDTVAR